MSHSPAAHAPHGTGSGPANDANDQIARREVAPTGVGYAAEVFVAEHQQFRARRGQAVLARHDLDVGPAQAHRNRVDEHRAVGFRWFRQIAERERVPHAGPHGQCSH
jgi:hypothetical protein